MNADAESGVQLIDEVSQLLYFLRIVLAHPSLQDIYALEVMDCKLIAHYSQ